MSSRRSLACRQRQPLHDIAATRNIEQHCQELLPQHTAMARAGLAVAKLTLALAPHARHIWVACGPGNNGEYGMAAALQLHRFEKKVSVSRCSNARTLPADTDQALLELQQAGIAICRDPPDTADFCIDALLGLGSSRDHEPTREIAEKILQLNAAGLPVLAIDAPSGLNVDTGLPAQHCVRANWTLSLLTLKPGFFTAQGRDFSGEIWLDDLELASFVQNTPAQAWLGAAVPTRTRLHASHKGSYGDVTVVGGASGMAGAALLAASAALHGGAGRVFLGMLDNKLPLLHPNLPELMVRNIDQLDLHANTLVCGCGGSGAIGALLLSALSSPRPVVLDADALNLVAKSPKLQDALSTRAARGEPTVITPHPLEAARLLGISVNSVQANRLCAAHALAQRYKCTVVLKGSGTVVIEPGDLPLINPTGNAKLATPGSGDVLAGMVGARLAQGEPAFEAACGAVYQHGLLADQWSPNHALTASSLARLSPV